MSSAAPLARVVNGVVAACESLLYEYERVLHVLTHVGPTQRVRVSEETAQFDRRSENGHQHFGRQQARQHAMMHPSRRSSPILIAAAHFRTCSELAIRWGRCVSEPSGSRSSLWGPRWRVWTV